MTGQKRFTGSWGSLFAWIIRCACIYRLLRWSGRLRCRLRLKKCYFETYRFSGDLDFTLTDPAHLDKQFLLTISAGITEWIYEQTGMAIMSSS